MQIASHVGIVIFVVTALLGCTPTLVPLKDALMAVQRDLLDSKVMNISDLIGSDNATAETVKKRIRSFQCFYDKANPVIPVFAQDFTLSLQGTLTVGGNISGGATGPVPAGNIGFSVSNAKTQGLTVPILWAPLDSLPKVFFQQQMGYLEKSFGLEKVRYGESQSFKEKYSESVQNAYLELTSKIKSLIDGWQASKHSCTQNEETGPFVPNVM